MRPLIAGPLHILLDLPFLLSLINAHFSSQLKHHFCKKVFLDLPEVVRLLVVKDLITPGTLTRTLLMSSFNKYLLHT